MRAITTQHIRKHGFQSAEDFKQHFGMAYLKAPSIRAKQSSFMETANPTKGRARTPDEVLRMSQARKGKGVGVAGKYERTREIRERISAGVTEHHRALGYRKGRKVWSNKARREVFVRSSWEERVLCILDQYDEIRSVEVEPLVIPYEFEGVNRRYMPDLLVTFTCGIRELWEIKPTRFMDLPRNQAKFEALHAYAKSHGMNSRVVTLENIERMERKTAVMVAMRA